MHPTMLETKRSIESGRDEMEQGKKPFPFPVLSVSDMCRKEDFITRVNIKSFELRKYCLMMQIIYKR
jgi:hypothetical protein